jgi:hypothetical protein
MAIADTRFLTCLVREVLFCQDWRRYKVNLAENVTHFERDLLLLDCYFREWQAVFSFMSNKFDVAFRVLLKAGGVRKVITSQ